MEKIDQILDKIIQKVENEKGCSRDTKIQDFVLPLDGWFFCCNPEKSIITNKSEFRENLKNFLEKNEKILLEDKKYLGVWKKQKAYYIDITSYEKDLNLAEQKVKKLGNNEISLYNPALDKTYFLS